MSDIDWNKTYVSIGESLHDLFDKREEGLFVPTYQREYTWEEENVNQLLDDLVSGIRELARGDDNATTFLGTIILTALDDRTDTVKQGEVKAQPTAVQSVIDGQQRIASIALLSIQTTECLKSLSKNLSAETTYSALKNHCIDLVEALEKLYSIKLGRGAKPPEKPKIIHAREDRWTFQGDDESYCSPVSQYIATYIRTRDTGKAADVIDSVSGARVLKNVELIDQWLHAVSTAHLSTSFLYEQFPVGEEIVTPRMQKYVLGFPDQDLGSQLESLYDSVEGGNDSHVLEIYQIFLFAHYLLRRCGINRLQPVHEEWGFDMFQALNSTGTPLTALETFVPQVMQEEKKYADKEWNQTPSKRYMDEIEELFESTKSNEQKDLRTNELLGAVGLCYEGTKLGNKFSRQRRWLANVYERELGSLSLKRNFLANVSRVAEFFSSAWYMEDEHHEHSITCVENHSEGALASLLVQYLRDARSKLSAPILARFYSQISNDDPAYVDEFVEATKACAAFFTLWRSAHSTSGLDDIYRRFFSRNRTNHCWNTNHGMVSAESLKKYFSDVLIDKGIGDETSWIQASQKYLLYTEVKTICRFALFVAGHDQVPDPRNPGLTMEGANGVCGLCDLARWKAPDHKSLEHVAPQNPPLIHSWDPRIYSENKCHDVGNLLLLPKNINDSIDNKEWSVKYLYYCHVGSRSKDEISSLSCQAQNRGVTLSTRATKALSVARYSCAVEPILALGEHGCWDAEFIDRRTVQIKEIMWNTLNSWLAT